MEQDMPPAVSTPQPDAPKNNSGIFIGILVFILGIIVGLALGKTTFLSTLRIPYLTATLTPTPLPTPTPTPNPTADWKIYQNTQYGFSLQYPEGWSVQEEHNKIMQAPYYGSKTSDSVNFTMDNGYLKIITGVTFESSGVGALLKTEQTIISGKNAVKETYTVSNQRVPMTEIIIKFPDFTPFYRIEALFPPADASIINQILSTFTFIEQSPTVSPTPAVPANWILHTFNTYGLTVYTPDDWQSSVTDYPQDSTSLIRFWKKSSPTIVPIQLDIKSNWDNTGNAQTQPKNFMVDGSIPAYRMDPPTKTQQTLDRYQTNVYFEHNSKVYVFECVHNWTPDYVTTCNTMLSTLQFTQ
ncbi:MAG: hypothetical protein NT149_00145 [Candidatus Gottesmanbacteria bacterium]|nr:hypothetical protein [Candidatus Gottesmanbacteria bacterium]